MIAELRERHYIAVEFGMESSFDETLRRVNRGHGWTESVRAVEKCHQRGIPCGGHFIVGLPGESDEMFLQTINRINDLRVGTAMGRDFVQHPEQYHLYSLDEYVALLANAIRHLRPTTAVERIVSEVPPRYRHEGLGWQGVKSHHVINRLCARLESIGGFQGQLFVIKRNFSSEKGCHFSLNISSNN